MLCAHLCIFFFFPHASTMHLLFPIFSLLSFSDFNSTSLLTTAYVNIYIFFLGCFACFTVWKIRFTFQSPKGGGGIYFTIVFQGHLHAKLFYSHSPLWAYIHLLRNPSIIKGELFFFFFFSLLCIWSYWTTYGTTLCIMLRKENLCNFVTWCGGHMEYHCSCNLFTPSYPACALSWAFYLHFVKHHCRTNPDIWFNRLKRTESSGQFQIHSHFVSQSEISHLS